MDAQGTCIIREATLKAGLLSAKLLETAGFRVKEVAASSAADMIMSKAGSTIGFILLDASNLEKQPFSQLESRWIASLATCGCHDGPIMMIRLSMLMRQKLARLPGHYSNNCSAEPLSKAQVFCTG